MKKEIVCIGCPTGCNLALDYSGTIISDVSGNRCKVGLEYAEKELFNPERTLTTTVKVKHGTLPLVSVRTNKPIPKSRIFDAMNLLAKTEAEAPIKIGETLIQNILKTGADAIATKNVSRKTQ